MMRCYIAARDYNEAKKKSESEKSYFSGKIKCAYR